MEVFENARTVRLKSHHDKYLVAGEDQESVFQDRDGSSRNAQWTVEIIEGDYVGFKSCCGKYLTASNKLFIPGRKGRNLRVVQTLPDKLNSSVQWEPVREEDDFNKVILATRYGNILHSNGGPPPWRNSVTHDTPRKNDRSRKKLLWEVEVVETPSDQWKEYDFGLITRSISYVRSICLDYTKKKKKNKDSSSESVKEGSKDSKKGQQSPLESIHKIVGDLIGDLKGKL